MDVTRITDGTRMGSGGTIRHRCDEGNTSHEYIMRHGCSKPEIRNVTGVYSSWEGVNQMKKSKILLPITMCMFTAGTLTSFAPAERMVQQKENAGAYEMYVNDVSVGVIRHAARGLNYYDDVLKDLKEKYPDNVDILSDVHFKEVDAGKAEDISEDKMAESIEKAVDIETEAFAIKVNGNTVCHVCSREQADHIVNAIQAPFVKSIETAANEVQEVKFAEDVKIEPEKVPYDKVTEEKEATDMLRQNTEDKKKYTIAEGDSLWTIAVANQTHVNDILALNPGLDISNLKPGQEIELSAEKKLLSVVTRERSSYQEEIPFGTEEKEDKTIPVGESRTVQEGRNGKKEIQVNIVRENGNEVSREILGENVVEQPVNKIIVKGTKKPEPVVVEDASMRRTSAGRSSKRAHTSVASRQVSVTNRGASRGSATGSAVVAFAQQQLRKPYVRGGKGPNVFDCSGFTSYVYNHFGYNVSSYSKAQAGVGRSISRANLAPGDLLLFSRKPGGSIGHVAIYMGGGQLIHASNSKGKIITKGLNGPYFSENYKGARRIIN